MHRQDIFIGMHGEGGTNSNSFLAYTGKPLAYPSLPQKDQHFLLDHSWLEKVPVEFYEVIVRKVSAIEFHWGCELRAMRYEIEVFF